MYCFPYPSRSTVPPLLVPYWEGLPYFLDGPYIFSTFIELAVGYELLHRSQWLFDINSTGPSQRNVLAVAIQSWLFFGLASEALGRDVSHGEFLEKSDGSSSQKFIDIRIPLRFWTELQDRWRHLEDSLSEDDYKQKKAHLEQCLEQTRTVIGRNDLDDQATHDEDLDLVLLSVHMLTYIISNLFKSPRIMRTYPKSKSTQVLIRRMIKNGWCRKRLNFIEVVHMFYPALYFMASFRPPQSDYEDHSSCTLRKCMLTGTLMEPFHHKNDCICRDVPVPLEQVAEIVAAGGIPLVRIARLGNGELTLQVVPYTRTSRFIAISHVWADRQFGSAENALPKCQVEYLDSVLAGLPREVDHWSLRDFYRDWRYERPSTTTDEIEPPSRTYDLFWLDTFCIPQHASQDHLKRKAIDSMNLIYAAASQTLVFDSCLQKFDAGLRPSSLTHGGRPSYYGPKDEMLLDTLSRIIASNWMGRAWTLQEGVLSQNLVFPMDRSLAYLHLLKPNFDEDSPFPGSLLLKKAKTLFEKALDLDESDSRIKKVPKNPDPFPAHIRHQLFRFVKSSLNVEEYYKYVRGQADRADRFINSHSRLQSRSTTQIDDLPLILMNMSGMNGNAVSKSKSTDERMKLLFYGLGTLPVELLFTECARPSKCAADSWIPREIVPEQFLGNHTLQLTQKGFKFHDKPGSLPMKFFLLPPSSDPHDEFIIFPHSEKEEGETKYLARVLTHSSDGSSSMETHGRCVVLSDGPLDPRGALFVISRVDGNEVYLFYECPIQYSDMSGADAIENPEQSYKSIGVARPAQENQEFIIEKSTTPEILSIARPQNPEQYSDRLIIIQELVCAALVQLQRFVVTDELLSNNWLLFVAWGVISWYQRRWVDTALHSLFHYAWMKTYDPMWNPNGRWKWFWRLSNYEPPIPFKTIMKHFCRLLFFACFYKNFYTGVCMVTLYWLRMFPKDELVNMYTTGMLVKGILMFF